MSYKKITIYSLDCGGIVGRQSIDNPITRYLQQVTAEPPVGELGRECKVVKLDDYLLLDSELKTTKEYLAQIKALLGVL